MATYVKITHYHCAILIYYHNFCLKASSPFNFKLKDYEKYVYCYCCSRQPFLVSKQESWSLGSYSSLPLFCHVSSCLDAGVELRTYNLVLKSSQCRVVYVMSSFKLWFSLIVFICNKEKFT